MYYWCYEVKFYVHLSFYNKNKIILTFDQLYKPKQKNE